MYALYICVPYFIQLHENRTSWQRVSCERDMFGESDEEEVIQGEYIYYVYIYILSI